MGARPQLIRRVVRQPHVMSPMNVAELLEFLRTQGTTWVENQRATHRPAGRRLSPSEHASLALFFDSPLLERVRITEVPEISNPDFYALLEQQGISMPLDYTQMAGITFVDTIVVSLARSVPISEWPALLFHEMVHVVQYEQFGLEEFVRRYVNGWAENGFSYDQIPLERCAYELDARFRQGQGSFPVADVVAQQLA